MAGRMLHVDASGVEAMASKYRETLGDTSVNECIRRALVDVRKSSKKMISDDVRRTYKVKAGWAKKGIGYMQIGSGSISLNGVSATIPLRGERMVIGSSDLNVTNRTTIANQMKKSPWKRKNIRIRFKVLQMGGTSSLPEKLPHQGGNEPFINEGIKNKRGKGIVFTRATAKRKPIVRVAAITLPQLPENQSRDEVLTHLQDKLYTRLKHHLEYALTQAEKSE